MPLERKIICRAPGDRCEGCPHYYGNKAHCSFAPPHDFPKLIDDFYIIRAMDIYGGSFLKSLARLCRDADSANLERIKDAFRSEWIKASAYAECLKQKEENEKESATPSP